MNQDFENTIAELDETEIEQVDGGFVCGGACIAGAAFAAGALFGAGVAIGWHAAENSD
ncbi:class IIb bacteriocin, lactobin A/cerein 7B family [Saccharospirillum salsuginis]|uniref:Class IIb bacteriocin, lactobin A/cerein 7B family n=1 Tax=Saccharospirillum salsuginis TaxID=418750 RepID=A0A918KBM8_9GAMM|nr:class IIb bacteriocin, lactobin A/cerein 7B family [Saccharospirillum salsuginis]GGX57849.1 hypothetical protein GCM10007392_26890 [Saccharospirillum salsuginis]